MSRPTQVKGPLKRGVRDSGFKSLNGPQIQDSNFKQARIQDSNFVWAVPVYIFRIHYIFEGGIQDSNLNPRKMAGIQDSNLVFKGPSQGVLTTCHFFGDRNKRKIQSGIMQGLHGKSPKILVRYYLTYFLHRLDIFSIIIQAIKWAKNAFN